MFARCSLGGTGTGRKAAPWGGTQVVLDADKMVAFDSESTDLISRAADS